MGARCRVASRQWPSWVRCSPRCAPAAALCHLASPVPFHPAPQPRQVYYLHRLPFLQQSTFPTLLGWVRLLRLIVIRERITLVHGHQVGAGDKAVQASSWTQGLAVPACVVSAVACQCDAIVLFGRGAERGT